MEGPHDVLIYEECTNGIQSYQRPRVPERRLSGDICVRPEVVQQFTQHERLGQSDGDVHRR